MSKLLVVGYKDLCDLALAYPVALFSTTVPWHILPQPHYSSPFLEHTKYGPCLHLLISTGEQPSQQILLLLVIWVLAQKNLP